MTETTTTQTTTTAPPWHAGIEADTLGWWQNKGYDLADPKVFATKITQQYRDLEKHVGVPADRIVKLPEKADAPEWADVRARFGVPKDAKEYDFAAVKHADGAVPDAGLLDAIRAAVAIGHVPKDKAPEVATAVVKYLDGVKTEQATVAAAALATEKTKLAGDWGTKFEFNKLTAMQGAQRLGVTPEEVSKLESVVGYTKIMEMFRKIGAATTEDTFVEGTRGNTNAVVTVQGAKSRLAELMTDQAWGARVTKGDAAAVREFENLTRMIAAEAA